MTQIFIRALDTALYLRADNSWTGTQEQARCFANPLEAMAHCLHCGLRHVQIVAHFDKSGSCDIIVPMHEDSPTAYGCISTGAQR